MQSLSPIFNTNKTLSYVCSVLGEGWQDFHYSSFTFFGGCLVRDTWFHDFSFVFLVFETCLCGCRLLVCTKLRTMLPCFCWKEGLAEGNSLLLVLPSLPRVEKKNNGVTWLKRLLNISYSVPPSYILFISTFLSSAISAEVKTAPGKIWTHVYLRKHSPLSWSGLLEFVPFESAKKRLKRVCAIHYRYVSVT